MMRDEDLASCPFCGAPCCWTVLPPPGGRAIKPVITCVTNGERGSHCGWAFFGDAGDDDDDVARAFAQRSGTTLEAGKFYTVTEGDMVATMAFRSEPENELDRLLREAEHEQLLARLGAQADAIVAEQVADARDAAELRETTTAACAMLVALVEQVDAQAAAMMRCVVDRLKEIA